VSIYSSLPSNLILSPTLLSDLGTFLEY